jgi:hypothetical protein
MPCRLAHDLRQRGGRGDRPGGDDRAGDAARLGLLAIAVDDVGDFLFGRPVQEIGGAFALLRHPHVERPVGLEGEAALGTIELHRGDADVERDAVHGVDAAIGKRLTHPGETLRNQRQAPPARSRQRLAFLYRIGVAIEGVDAGRSFLENGPGVAAGAESAVDMGLAGLRIEAGDHFGEKHGDVRGGRLRAHG